MNEMRSAMGTEDNVGVPGSMHQNGINPQPDGVITGRRIQWFHHKSLPSWGYKEEQMDTFAVLHPFREGISDEEKINNHISDKKYPLYVVFHSAGHDVYSAVGCIWEKGNHDIYHAPKEMFALYLDCRQHENDWWWGGNSALEVFGEDRGGIKKQPVENRCIATVEWVMAHYPIDWNRVYAVGNSMGGSGALGVAMCRGDIFAAVKVNVPAGVHHVADRCDLEKKSENGFSIPDPPVLVDYSAQNDQWSAGHQVLYKGMQKNKYLILGYWGNFGHENNDERIYKVNDLVHSFDPFSVCLNEPYPVFTNADTDDLIPWADDGYMVSEAAGQVNGYFRWGKAEETGTSVSIPLRLMSAKEWTSRIAFPECAKTDVTLRRLQKCKFRSGMQVKWQFGKNGGVVFADEHGLVTIPGIVVSTKEENLILHAE